MLNKVFYSAPPLIKNLFLSYFGLFNNIKRKGRIYKKQVNELREIESFNANQIGEFQLNELKKLLKECQNFVLYYKKTFNDSGLTEEKINMATSIGELLDKIPILDKETLRKNIKDFSNQNSRRKSYYKVSTSGSTGTPLNVYFDKESTHLTFALWRRFYDWMGLPEKFKNVRFSGRVIVSPKAKKPPFWVQDYFNNFILMSSYHLTEINIPSYIRKLNSFKPELIDGYPTAINTIAEFILKNNIVLNFKPISIATTAETLFDFQRQNIEEAFKCKVYNQYASSEGATFIAEANDGLMYIYPESGIVEFINRQNNKFEMLITSFRNYKTPLIRYRIGDVAELFDDEPQEKLYNFKVVKSIIGRTDDVLYTKERGFVGRMDTAYKGLNGIVKSQIIQKSVNSIVVNQVVDKHYNKNVEQIFIMNIRERLGKEINIKFNYCDDIPLGPNGKFRAVIREFELPN